MMSDTRAAGIGTIEPAFGIGDLDEDKLSQELWELHRERETRGGGTTIAIVRHRGLTWVLYSDEATAFADAYRTLNEALDYYVELVAETFGSTGEVIG